MLPFNIAFLDNCEHSNAQQSLGPFLPGTLSNPLTIQKHFLSSMNCYSNCIFFKGVKAFEINFGLHPAQQYANSKNKHMQKQDLQKEIQVLFTTIAKIQLTGLQVNNPETYEELLKKCKNPRYSISQNIRGTLQQKEWLTQEGEIEQDIAQVLKEQNSPANNIK